MLKVRKERKKGENVWWKREREWKGEVSRGGERGGDESRDRELQHR